MDDCSKYAWAFPLQQKNEAAGKLKALILHLRARGKSVHTLRSDHGGEFTSNEFEGWLEAQGIRHEFLPSYAHKSNGMIKRFHGTIMPRLRAVVHEHQLPLGVVPYLFIGLTYLYNRMPHSSIKQKIPFEVFNDEELTSLAHLRILGARATESSQQRTRWHHAVQRASS
jgi:transposase InsO family protein